ncbi:MAG: hypothetical protein ACAI44_25535 [Candidatus Sericytochromatia bacterium]
MRILLSKLSDQRHLLQLVAADGGREQVELETRSVLIHDFLHYAVEAEAGLQDGFWGLLAAGRSLAEMNDRTGQAMQAYSGSLMLIEKIVGAMSGAVKGRSATEMMQGFEAYAAAMDESLPPWLDEDLILRVQERMRRLQGHWKATPYGGTMELEWA